MLEGDCRWECILGTETRLVSSRYECKLKGLIFERDVREDEQNEVADGVWKQEGRVWSLSV